MKFAFLVHPLTQETTDLLNLDPDGALRRHWGSDLFGFCGQLHRCLQTARQRANASGAPRAHVVDELSGLVSPLGHATEGRLYEIPMDAAEIVDDPSRAVAFAEEAIDLAQEWGAELIGLGSMTGVVGGQGTHLASYSPVAVTTGNSLTVFAAVQNLYRVLAETGLDLSRETVAVVGIPGSIASAVAVLLAPQCRQLLLVARRSSSRAKQLAGQLNAELILDIPSAMSRARVVVSATSTGSCIDQRQLQPGSVVIDVAVPTDVQGNRSLRDDVLILTGGFAKLPNTMSWDSNYLWFHHGVTPSCMAETMVLALENRAECFSLGRNLDLDNIQEIGAIAQSHGLDFTQLYSFGHRLEDSALVQFRKALARQDHVMESSRRRAPTAEHLAPRAASLYARHVNPVLGALGAPSGFVKTFARGQGAYLWDESGKRYLDFASGFGSVNLGHQHPRVVAAVQAAISAGAPGFNPSSINPFAAALAEELATCSPNGLEMVFFANSGTEAVEAALKLARAATRRAGLLYCERSYHGKTLGSLSVTGNPTYQRPFGPLVGECEAVPFGDLEALERALATRRYAAFIVEPIQAEGGMIVPPAGYLREAQSLCRASKTLLIVDEVQTGLGRTGTLFAVEHEGVEPDLMTLAKSLGGGMVPIGAMLARRDLWMQAYGTAQSFLLHTSTFGGGSLACAAGLATLQALREERLAENAEARGQQLFEGIAELCGRCDCLKDVRGRGLLLGLEFAPLPATVAAHWKEVDPSGATQYLVPNMAELLDSFSAVYVLYNLLQVHGIYCQATRSNPRVLRIQPPLVITEAQASEFLAALEATCQEVDGWLRSVDGLIAKSGLGQHKAAERQRAAGEPDHVGTTKP
jgi:acetylornithine/succinyldiaminopimelate/putrescine aminotransferase/predicted amino acid dehydrogenase